MKLQIASDLHLEFLQRSFPGERLISPAHGADILVLAGDIANATQAIELFNGWPVPVLYLAGNHEFYGGSMAQVRAELRQAAARTHITFMDNDCVDFGGVRFLGTTLWTDYRLARDRSQRQLMENAELRLADHSRMRHGDGSFTAQHALAEHELSRAWLEHALDMPYIGRTVVVSHHGPHPLSVHPRYVGDHLNAAFVSDLSALFPKVDLWIHGHVHDSFDYTIGRCRVVANPRGYALDLNSARRATDLAFENAAFKWACVVDV